MCTEVSAAANCKMCRVLVSRASGICAALVNHTQARATGESEQMGDLARAQLKAKFAALRFPSLRGSKHKRIAVKECREEEELDEPDVASVELERISSTWGTPANEIFLRAQYHLVTMF